LHRLFGSSDISEFWGCYGNSFMLWSFAWL